MLAAGVIGLWMTKRGSSRRRWSRMQSFPRSPAVMVSGRSRVFAWRREARKQAASVQQDSPAFVPAVVAPEPVARRPPKQRKRQATRDAGMIELEIDGIAMRAVAPIPGRWRR